MAADLDFQMFVRTEAARFGEVLAATDPSARVPSCPDWDAADLLWHLTEVQLFWAVIVRDRLDDPRASEAAKPPRPENYPGLLDGFTRATGALLDALDAAADDVPVWTWFAEDQSAGFVRRRQAHEALIHRLDAELTAGTVTDLDPALASDGADEALRVMYGGYPGWGEFTRSGALGRISASDTGALWSVELGSFSGVDPDSGKAYDALAAFEVLDRDVKPAFTVTGTARDLDAWLWNRPTLAYLEIAGDRAAFERFHAVIVDGLQ